MDSKNPITSCSVPLNKKYKCWIIMGHLENGKRITKTQRFSTNMILKKRDIELFTF